MHLSAKHTAECGTTRMKKSGRVRRGGRVHLKYARPHGCTNPKTCAHRHHRQRTLENNKAALLLPTNLSFRRRPAHTPTLKPLQTTLSFPRANCTLNPPNHGTFQFQRVRPRTYMYTCISCSPSCSGSRRRGDTGTPPGILGTGPPGSSPGKASWRWCASRRGCGAGRPA